MVYDADGRILNVSGRKISLNLTPELYKRFESSPVRFQLQVSAPVKQESFLRLIVHDVPANRYGVVEIPTAEVGHLQPLEAQNAPATPGKSSPCGGGSPRPPGKQ